MLCKVGMFLVCGVPLLDVIVAPAVMYSPIYHTEVQAIWLGPVGDE